jgi:hypothetical protein
VNATHVFEKGTSRSSNHEYEEEIVRRWWALPLNVNLPLNNGESCQLLYAGRPGSSHGPDIRDAVLSFTSCRSGTCYAGVKSQRAENTVGDVEIHVHATDWFAHQHHTDVRYNNVVLHVVLICDSSRPTLRQDGTVIPTCSLNDLSSNAYSHHLVQWPCHHVIAQIYEDERTHLFTLAGMLRFETKTQVFFELLRDARPTDIFSAYDVCLIPALAEALGFGRDRAFFRAAGLHLIGTIKTIPEPLGHAPQPSPLDANRLHMLRKLAEQWRTTGAWDILRQALVVTSPELMTTDSHPRREGVACLAHAELHYSDPSRAFNRGEASVTTLLSPSPALTRVSLLRDIFEGLSKSRTDILICNVVLPFAAAVAQQENDSILAEYARNLYFTYPGLSSNQITRAMCKQLLLKNEPKGACQQQGLHYIYTQTCREKRCNECLIGKQGV